LPTIGMTVWGLGTRTTQIITSRGRTSDPATAARRGTSPGRPPREGAADDAFRAGDF
jgi:hypothetical protein